MKFMRFIGVLLWLPVAVAQSSPKLLASSEGPVMVRSVRPLAEASGPVVEIISDRPLIPAISTLKDPLRLVIDLPNARLSGSKRQLDFRGSEIKGVRVNQFQQNPPIARIVVDLTNPIAYTWDAAGNRLMIRLRPAAEQPVAPAPAVSRAVLPAPGVSGGVVLAGSRVATGSAVTAGEDTAVLRLGRGGEVLVCPRTTVSVSSSLNGRSLMLSMNTGALEAHYSLDAAADSIVTPDFRILLAGPGEFHYGVSADAHGNTCLQSLPGNTAGVIVSELLGDGTYQVKAAQHVMFHGGKLGAVDTSVPENCGCPASSPPQMQASTAAPSGSGRPVQGSETAPLPALQPNDVHVQVDVPMVFRASDPPPVLPAPAREAKLLPLRDEPIPVSLDTVVVPPKPAHHGFMGKIKGFFSAIFG